MQLSRFTLPQHFAYGNSVFITYFQVLIASPMMREKTESSDYERLVLYSEYTSSKLGKDDPIDSHENSV